jgi:hypothetical protein
MEDIIKDLEIAQKRLNISVAGLKAIIEESNDAIAILIAKQTLGEL